MPPETLEGIVTRIMGIPGGDSVEMMETLQSLRDANAAALSGSQKDGTDWKARYDDLHEKYKERFMQAANPTPEDTKPKGISSLFKKKD